MTSSAFEAEAAASVKSLTAVAISGAFSAAGSGLAFL
jgi:hypothetical protein